MCERQEWACGITFVGGIQLLQTSMGQTTFFLPRFIQLKEKL